MHKSGIAFAIGILFISNVFADQCAVGAIDQDGYNIGSFYRNVNTTPKKDPSPQYKNAVYQMFEMNHMSESCNFSVLKNGIEDHSTLFSNYTWAANKKNQIELFNLDMVFPEKFGELEWYKKTFATMKQVKAYCFYACSSKHMFP